MVRQLRTFLLLTSAPFSLFNNFHSSFVCRPFPFDSKALAGGISFLNQYALFLKHSLDHSGVEFPSHVCSNNVCNDVLLQNGQPIQNSSRRTLRSDNSKQRMHSPIFPASHMSSSNRTIHRTSHLAARSAMNAFKTVSANTRTPNQLHLQ